LVAAMVDACIEVIEATPAIITSWGLTSRETSQFVHNTSGFINTAASTIGARSKDVMTNDASFWCIQGVGAYEENHLYNNDWDSSINNSKPIMGVAITNGGIFLLFQEAIRDFAKSGFWNEYVGPPNPTWADLNRLTETKTILNALFYGIVNQAGLVPKAELSFANVLGNTFRRFADHRQLEIVNRTGTIQTDMCQEAFLHQLNQVRPVPGTKNMGSEHKENSRLTISGFTNPLGQKINCRMHECCRTFGINHHGNLNIVNPLPKRLQDHLAAVELLERHNMSIS